MDKRRDKCPIAVIRRLKSKGLMYTSETGLSPTLSLDAILDAFWNDEWFVKRMLMKYPPAKRKIMLLEPGFSKVDRYILNLYTNWSKEKGALTVKTVISVVKTYFKMDISKERVRKIRRKAYYAREYQCKQDQAE